MLYISSLQDYFVQKTRSLKLSTIWISKIVFVTRTRNYSYGEENEEHIKAQRINVSNEITNVRVLIYEYKYILYNYTKFANFITYTFSILFPIHETTSLVPKFYKILYNSRIYSEVSILIKKKKIYIFLSTLKMLEN